MSQRWETDEELRLLLLEHGIRERPPEAYRENCVAAVVEERRRMPRMAVDALRAWISGPVRTPAIVRDFGAGGARVEPLVPLRVGQSVFIDFLSGSGSEVLASRRAIVLRTQGGSVGLCFEESEC